MPFSRKGGLSAPPDAAVGHLTAARALATGSRAAVAPGSPDSAGNGSPSHGHRLTHLRALDGLRGVAVLAVVLYHFSPDIAPGGFLGVDIFFVLSGFLITSLLVNEREAEGRISLGKFWARRARRLLPALFLVLAAVGIYAVVVATRVTAHHIAEDGLAALGYFANWHFITSGQGYVEQFVTAEPSPLRHTWSLAIEEQFYLLWPLLVVGVGALAVRLRRRGGTRSAAAQRHDRRMLATVCLVLGALSLVEMVVLFDASDPNRVYYGTDTRAFLLLIGAAIGALTAGGLRVARRSPRIALIVAGCVASAALVGAIGAVETTDSFLYEGGYGVIAVLIAIVLVAAAQSGVNPLARLFEGRPLVGLGLISYGVYLWHWPVVVWVTASGTGLDGAALFAVRSVITLSVTLASFWLIEQPIRQRRWPRLVARRGLIPITAAVALAVLLVVPVVAFPSVAAPPNVKPSRSSVVTAAGYEAAPHCDGTTVVPPELAGTGPRVELFGNSVANEILPCFRELVEEQGGELIDVVATGSPPCQLVQLLAQQLANPANRPDIAIWHAFDWLYDNSTCNSDWRIHVQAALDMWEAAGVKVYLAPIVPHILPSPDPALVQVRKNGVTIDVPSQTPEFEAWAAEDPTRVKLVDVGVFIRDGKDSYQWRMPCLAGGEPGCAKDGTIGVRYTDGLHYCSDPQYDGETCVDTRSGGNRRVAAALALQIEELGYARDAPTALPK